MSQNCNNCGYDGAVGGFYVDRPVGKPQVLHCRLCHEKLIRDEVKEWMARGDVDTFSSRSDKKKKQDRSAR